MPAFKNINIGFLINKAVTESGIEISRICNFFKCREEDINEMFQSKSLDAETLLRWCKLLEYDFFRIYSQHLILYAPPASQFKETVSKENCSLPVFRKNIYTREIIVFILELIQSGKKTKPQVIDEYKIPKSTLYKWIKKHSHNDTV